MNKRERVARAICATNGQDWERLPATGADACISIKEGGTGTCRDDYFSEADAVIAAYEAEEELSEAEIEAAAEALSLDKAFVARYAARKARMAQKHEKRPGPEGPRRGEASDAG